MTASERAGALTAALELLDRALAAQDRAEAALRDAATPDQRGADLARRLGATAREFAHCRQDWPAVATAAGVATMLTSVDAALHHHQEMVEQAMTLLYRPPRAATERVRRGYAEGLGEPALTLMEARRQVRVLVAAATTPPRS